MTERNDLAVLRCWHCSAWKGERQSGMDLCWRCEGTGSVFWADGRSFPYTSAGEKAARASLNAEER